jgi:hypothetical protein
MEIGGIRMNCRTCGKEIGNEPSTSHRYFGSRHIACLDRALEQTKLDIIETDKLIKELEK